jgi:hypothetical protein
MGETQEEVLQLPLALIIDLVNHLYIFAGGAAEIDEGFARLFAVCHTPAESGPWWRLIYGAGFHLALHQIAHRLRVLPENESRDVRSALSREEALRFLPYLEEVEAVLSVWRHPTLPVRERKRRISALFPEEIARVVLPPEEEPLPNQFYEEGLAMGGRGMSDFFSYLGGCPLPRARPARVSLQQAIAYWAWIDNVKAFRTFASEEGAKNPRVVRMQQALRFYELVERLPKKRWDFSVVTLTLSPHWRGFLRTQDLTLLALVADSYGRNRWFNYYDRMVFIEHATLGDAFRALQSRSPLWPEHSRAREAHTCMLLLRASALNIVNQQELLRGQACIGGHEGVEPLLVARRLLEQAEVLMEGAPFSGGALSLLETAKCLTDSIAQADPLSPHASAGLAFMLEQMRAGARTS